MTKFIYFFQEENEKLRKAMEGGGVGLQGMTGMSTDGKQNLSVFSTPWYSLWAKEGQMHLAPLGYIYDWPPSSDNGSLGGCQYLPVPRTLVVSLFNTKSIGRYYSQKTFRPI